MANNPASEDDLYRRVAEIIETAHERVVRSVNTAMVHAYWFIGREIVQVEQQGEARAEYGDRVMARLANSLPFGSEKGLESPHYGG